MITKKQSINQTNILDLPYDCMLYITSYFRRPHEVNSFIRTRKIFHRLLTDVSVSGSCENAVFNFIGRYDFDDIGSGLFFERDLLTSSFYPFVRIMGLSNGCFAMTHRKNVEDVCESQLKLMFRFPNIRRLTFYASDLNFNRDGSFDPLSSLLSTAIPARGVSVHDALPVFKCLSRFKGLSTLVFKMGSEIVPANEHLEAIPFLTYLNLPLPRYRPQDEEDGRGTNFPPPFPLQALEKMQKLRILKLTCMFKLLFNFGHIDDREHVPLATTSWFLRQLKERVIPKISGLYLLALDEGKRYRDIYEHEEGAVTVTMPKWEFLQELVRGVEDKVLIQLCTKCWTPKPLHEFISVESNAVQGVGAMELVIRCKSCMKCTECGTTTDGRKVCQFCQLMLCEACSVICEKGRCSENGDDDGVGICKHCFSSPSDRHGGKRYRTFGIPVIQEHRRIVDNSFSTRTDCYCDDLNKSITNWCWHCRGLLVCNEQDCGRIKCGNCLKICSGCHRMCSCCKESKIGDCVTCKGGCCRKCSRICSNCDGQFHSSGIVLRSYDYDSGFIRERCGTYMRAITCCATDIVEQEVRVAQITTDEDLQPIYTRVLCGENVRYVGKRLCHPCLEKLGSFPTPEGMSENHCQFCERSFCREHAHECECCRKNYCLTTSSLPEKAKGSSDGANVKTKTKTCFERCNRCAAYICPACVYKQSACEICGAEEFECNSSFCKMSSTHGKLREFGNMKCERCQRVVCRQCRRECDKCKKISCCFQGGNRSGELSEKKCLDRCWLCSKYLCLDCSGSNKNELFGMICKDCSHLYKENDWKDVFNS